MTVKALANLLLREIQHKRGDWNVVMAIEEMDSSVYSTAIVDYVTLETSGKTEVILGGKEQ